MGEDKQRTYVRAIEDNQYGLQGELRRLRSAPRVIKGRDLPWHGGPQAFGKQLVDPSDGLTQLFHVHMEDLAPGGKSNKHGHMNEAMLYILRGKGHEIHDGKRYDWEAGDVVVVHAGCVHQHFNDDPVNPATILIMKSKPLYLFANLIFQGTVEKSPKEPVPGAEDYQAADQWD